MAARDDAAAEALAPSRSLLGLVGKVGRLIADSCGSFGDELGASFDAVGSRLGARAALNDKVASRSLNSTLSGAFGPSASAEIDVEQLFGKVSETYTLGQATKVLEMLSGRGFPCDVDRLANWLELADTSAKIEDYSSIISADAPDDEKSWDDLYAFFDGFRKEPRSLAPVRKIADRLKSLGYEKNVLLIQKLLVHLATEQAIEIWLETSEAYGSLGQDPGILLLVAKLVQEGNIKPSLLVALGRAALGCDGNPGAMAPRIAAVARSLPDAASGSRYEAILALLDNADPTVDSFNSFFVSLAVTDFDVDWLRTIISELDKQRRKPNRATLAMLRNRIGDGATLARYVLAVNACAGFRLAPDELDQVVLPRLASTQDTALLCQIAKAVVAVNPRGLTFERTRSIVEIITQADQLERFLTVGQLLREGGLPTADVDDVALHFVSNANAAAWLDCYFDNCRAEGRMPNRKELCELPDRCPEVLQLTRFLGVRVFSMRFPEARDVVADLALAAAISKEYSAVLTQLLRQIIERGKNNSVTGEALKLIYTAAVAKVAENKA